MVKALPSRNHEATSRGRLMTRIMVPIGSPQAKLNRVATPVTPPGAIWLGAVKMFTDKAYSTLPSR